MAALIWGPPLAAMLRRVADCPPVFLEVDVAVEALLFDLGFHLGAELPRVEGPVPTASAWRGMLALAAWMVMDPWFADKRGLVGPIAALATNEDLGAMSRVVAPARVLADEDRREELVRTVLWALGLAPEGEDTEVATARLSARSSTVRERLLREAREREQRAKELRAKMAEQQAREAASRWGWES